MVFVRYNKEEFFMEDFKNMLLNTINDFAKGQNIDWTAALENEEKFETLVDSIDVLIEGVAFLPNVDEAKKINLLGKLVLMRSYLSYSFYNDKQMNSFIDNCKKLEPVLREVITCSNWLTNAQDRFSEYAEFEESITEETELTPKQIEHFRPILMALALLAIIALDQDEYNLEEDEDDCDDEQCA